MSKHPRKLVYFVGTAGSGKSYIAKQLAALVGADYIATGDIARALPDAHQDLSAGKLYHDDAPILQGVVNFITDPCRSACVIVDGVPRNENQVHWLIKFSNETTYDWVIVYVDALLGTRMRRVIARARDIYDGPETVIKRLSQDLLEMTKVYDLCEAVFTEARVLKLMSEKDGDVTAEIAAIMDKMHGITTENLIEGEK